MSSKKKQGEVEAQKILELLGMRFDEFYCDDNSKESMPDLRYEDGRYLEVTHTNHNQKMVKFGNDYEKKSIAAKRKIEQDAKAALDRIRCRKYDFKDGRLTNESKKQFLKDQFLIKKHYSLDTRNLTKRSERNCDCPVFEHNSDNIIDVIKAKNQKHSSENIDLFVFITEDEMRSVKYLLETMKYNGASRSFMNSILKAGFENLYLCVWDFEECHYNLYDPTLLVFEICDGKSIKYHFAKYKEKGGNDETSVNFQRQ